MAPAIGLSHVKALGLAEALHDNLDVIMVAEDDAFGQFSDQFLELVQRALDMRQEWDIFRLHYFPNGRSPCKEVSCKVTGAPAHVILPANVDFHLLYLPCSETYRAEVIHEHHETQFKFWAHLQGNVIYFAQAPNDAYYDIKHANQVGRKLYSDQLLKWIQSPFSGTHPKLSTERPTDRRDL